MFKQAYANQRAAELAQARLAMDRQPVTRASKSCRRNDWLNLFLLTIAPILSTELPSHVAIRFTVCA